MAQTLTRFVRLTLIQEGSWNFRMGWGPASIGVPLLKLTCPIETNATALPFASRIGEPDCPASVGPVESELPQTLTWTFRRVGCHDTPSSASMNPWPVAGAAMVRGLRPCTRSTYASFSSPSSWSSGAPRITKSETGSKNRHSAQTLGSSPSGASRFLYVVSLYE